MMLHCNGNNNGGKQSCSLLTVACEGKKLGEGQPEDRKRWPFPELTSSGWLEVRTLSNPSLDEFRRSLGSFRPDVVYLQGQLLLNDEVGALVWDGTDLSDADAVSKLFGHALPTTVCLEIPNGEQFADAIHSKGVSYVIFWQSSFSSFAASHFRHALFTVIQSSPCHTWEAFQIAHASFRLYCIRNNSVLPSNSQGTDCKLGPSVLGEAPTIDVVLPNDDGEEEEENLRTNVSAVKIHDDDVTVRFLIFGVACSLMRASKLQNRFSAPPPLLQAGSFTRGVVTMRCDISTCSRAHISLLVSGSAQTCFDDQQLENHIKEAVERTLFVQAIPSSKDINQTSLEPRTSASIACGATVFEVSSKAPLWALQVFRQLAPESSYRSFAALGIASIQGVAVTSFERDDAKRLLFFCTR